MANGNPRKKSIVLLLVFFLCCFQNQTMAQKKKVILSDGVIFQSEGAISFSESEWIVATDISFDQIEITLKTVESWLLNKLAENSPVKDGLKKFPGIIKEQITNRATHSLSHLQSTAMRFSAIRDAIKSNTKRPKRTPLLAAGGKVLNWLFGVSTSEELEAVNSRLNLLSTETTHIVHAMEQHASLVNESLWETRTNTKAILALATSCGNLDRSLKKIDLTIENVIKEVDEKWNIHYNISEAFRAVNDAIEWAERFTNDLGLGITSIVLGKLPNRLFPPAQLRKVLQDIKSTLPETWALSPGLKDGNLWRAYEEAQVKAAAHGNGMRIFIHVPVYEFLLEFSLHRILRLPRVIGNGTMGLSYGNLPGFLAVSQDMRSFMELDIEDVRECMSHPKFICRLSMPINRKLPARSCAVALFRNDFEQKSRDCIPMLTSWMGSKAISLGNHQWAISSNQRSSLTIKCPFNPDFQEEIRALLTFDVFEVPMGCNAYTEEWIFPASFSKKSGSLILQTPSVIPSLKYFSATIQAKKTFSGTETSSSFHPAIDEQVDTILSKNENLTDQYSKAFEKSFEQLKEEEKNRMRSEKETRYPFELGAVSAFLFILLIVEFSLLWYQKRSYEDAANENIRRLENRINELEQKMKDVDK